VLDTTPKKISEYVRVEKRREEEKRETESRERIAGSAKMKYSR
jgi:hypothetical protein